MKWNEEDTGTARRGSGHEWSTQKPIGRSVEVEGRLTGGSTLWFAISNLRFRSRVWNRNLDSDVRVHVSQPKTIQH